MSWPTDGLPRFKLVKTASEYSILDRAFSHRTVEIFARSERLALARLAALNAEAAA